MMKCLFVLFVVAAPLPAEDKKPIDDKAKLQGTWTVEAFEIDGKKLPATDIPLKSLIFEAGKLTVKRVDDTKSTTFKLNAAQKPPQIDITPDGADMVVKFLYQLDGDTLKLYGPKNDTDDRPASYEAAPLIVTLKREKK